MVSRQLSAPSEQMWAYINNSWGLAICCKLNTWCVPSLPVIIQKAQPVCPHHRNLGKLSLAASMPSPKPSGPWLACGFWVWEAFGSFLDSGVALFLVTPSVACREHRTVPRKQFHEHAPPPSVFLNPTPCHHGSIEKLSPQTYKAPALPALA